MSDRLVKDKRYDTSTALEIITGKYECHLPFYRRQDWFARSGWTMSRSTMRNMLVAAEFALRRLAVYFRQLLVQDSVIGCDKTTVTLVTPAQIPAVKDDPSPRDRRRYEVLSEAIAKDRPCLAARMGAYRGGAEPLNSFEFTVSRERYGPDEVLSEFRGFLMADCWSGIQQIHLRSNARITRAACASHARRKVHECQASHPQQASVLPAVFRQLYDIEDRGKELSSEDRRTLRQVESVAVLKRMRDYLDSAAVGLPHVLPKSDFAKAVN